MGRKYDEMKAEGLSYYEMLDEADIFDEFEMKKIFEGAISGEIPVDKEYGFSSGWLADHFFSTAEHLVENYDEYDEMMFARMEGMAIDEIEILKKYGYGTSSLEEMLRKAVENKYRKVA